MRGHHAVVFDSGLGGLSIVQALRHACADQGVTARIDYLADHAFFPYGPRSESEIRTRVVTVIGAYLARPDAAPVVVIGCNTASTAALEALRATYPMVRFVGVVPAIKPAARLSQTGVIGLLATPGTVRRAYSERLIADFAAHCTVVRHGAPGLAGLAESYLAGHSVDVGVVRAELEPLFSDPRLDAVVLGCTHYPLLGPLLIQAAPWPVQWCDSGAAVARQVLRQWTEIGDQAISDGERCLTTASDPMLDAAFATYGYCQSQVSLPSSRPPAG